ncbi:MAG: hypothetical protein LUF78_01865 [Clostridiales bacterium]|nr:hypothetical protein [Clostridiales bacterium]
MKRFWGTLTAIILLSGGLNTVQVCAESEAVEYNTVHITEEFQGPDSVFRIDADQKTPQISVYTGTLFFSDIGIDQGKRLYGDPEKWEVSDFVNEGECYRYQKEDIYVMLNPERHGFYYEVLNESRDLPDEEKVTEAEARALVNQAVDSLGIQAQVIGRFGEETDPDGVYSYALGGMIEGMPVASMSLPYPNGSVEISGDHYSYVGFVYYMVPGEKSEAELLDFTEIMEKVQVYAEAGFITLPENNEPICSVSLEYYVENTVDGLRFYPVWNFCVKSIAGTPVMLGRDRDDLFYINALDGMLVKSAL